MELALAFRISLLDGFVLRSASSPASAEDLPRGVQRLPAFLCLSGRPARSAVAGQLRPDVPEDHAQASLRSALWRLRRTVPGIVETPPGGLPLAVGVHVGVRELACWARAVRDPHVDAARVTVPGALLRGDLLPGWYDDWVLLERETLRRTRLRALEAAAGRLAAAGRHGEVMDAAYLALRDEPLRESAHRTLVRLLLAKGNVAEAVRAYEVFRRVL